MSTRRRQSAASVATPASSSRVRTPTESVRSGRSKNRVTVHGKDANTEDADDADSSSADEQPERVLRKRVSQSFAKRSGSSSTPATAKKPAEPARRQSGRIDSLASRRALVEEALSTPQPTSRSRARQLLQTLAKSQSANGKLATQPTGKDAKTNGKNKETSTGKSSKRRRANDSEQSEAESESGDAMDMDDENSTHSGSSGRQVIVPPIKTKKWATHGMYTGQDVHMMGKSTLKAKKGREPVKKSALPLPMYKGLTILEEGRDFVLPYTIFNLDPWVYPKPPGWKSLKRNIFVGEATDLYKHQKNSMKKAYQSTVCGCTADTGGCGPNCLNRVMYYECDKGNCGLKDCQNRPFRDLSIRVENDTWFDDGIEIVLTKDKGYGLRACRSFAPNQIIVEYIGEIITQEECDRRMQTVYKDNESYYLMEFDNSLIIDATRGSLARFVNHACTPNCKMEKWMVAGQPRMALFAGDEGIEVGEELTYDYNFSWFSGASTQICKCGSENCRGLVGKRSERRVSTPIPEPIPPKVIKRTKIVPEKKIVKKIIRRKVVKASNARVVRTQKVVATGRTRKPVATKKVAVKPKRTVKIVKKKKAVTKAVIPKRKPKVVRRVVAPKKVKVTKPQKPRQRAVPKKKKSNEPKTPAVLKKPKEKTHKVSKPVPKPKPKPEPEKQIIKRAVYRGGETKMVEMPLLQASHVHKSPAVSSIKRRGERLLPEGELPINDNMDATPTTSKTQLITEVGVFPEGTIVLDPALPGVEATPAPILAPEEFVVPDSEPEHNIIIPVIEEDEYDSAEDDYANDLNFVKWPSTVARAYGIADTDTNLARYRKVQGYYQKINADDPPYLDELASKYTYVKVPRNIRVQQKSQWESDPEQEIEKATAGPPQYVRIGQSYVLYTKEVALGKLGKARTLYMRHHGRYKPWALEGPLPRKTLKEKLKLKQKRLPKPPPRDLHRVQQQLVQPDFMMHEQPQLYERPDYRPGMRSPGAFMGDDGLYDGNRSKRKFDNGIDSLLNVSANEAQAKRMRYVNPDETRNSFGGPNPFAPYAPGPSQAHIPYMSSHISGPDARAMLNRDPLNTAFHINPNLFAEENMHDAANALQSENQQPSPYNQFIGNWGSGKSPNELEPTLDSNPFEEPFNSNINPALSAENGLGTVTQNGDRQQNGLLGIAENLL